jgi:hypothetical protein
VKTESVVAVVVAKPRPAPADKSAAVPTPEDDRAQLSDELRLLCREHLAPYEVPQQFEFVAELPRSPLGKLLKRELRKPQPGAAPAASRPPEVDHAEPAPAATAVAKAGHNGNGSANGNGRHSPGGNGVHSTGAWRNGADKKEAM